MTGAAALVAAMLAGTAPAPLCQYPTSVQDLHFSAARYPDIQAHETAALERGWPEILVLDRDGAAQRRTRLLANVPTVAGEDRDEYPPAIGREGWLADVALVPSSENRSHGASMGAQLRGLCTGVRFRYVWMP
jgi:hypothetical protein